MPSQVKTIPKYSPATAEEAANVILEFLSSDGTDEALHERSMAGLRFLEQNHSIFSTELHKMRMALVARRSDRITAKVRETS